MTKITTTHATKTTPTHAHEGKWRDQAGCPFASCLNEAGQAHVAAELNRLGLNWSVSGTCSEIEDKPGFMDLTSGSSYDYEISNNAAGKRSYGAFGCIEILADKHVVFEVCE